MEPEPPLDLERFATLSAELHAGTNRDELCAREGITLADWNASQETWLSRLADETACKRFVLTNRYNTAFVARRRALAHGPRFPAQKPVAAKQPAPPPVEVAPPLPVMVSMPALAAPPPPLYREPEPVYREPAPPPPVVREPAPAARPGTMALPAFTEPLTAALPFAPATDGAESGTLTVTGASPLQQSHLALPFKRAAPGEPETAPVAVVRPVEPSLDSGTVVGAMSPFATPATLPFQRAVAPAPPKAPPPPKAPASSPVMAGESTVYGAVSPLAAGAAALPFQHASAPTQAVRLAVSPSGAGLPFHPQAGHAPTAAPAAPAAGATRLTLEQFASLTAEIAVNPRGAAQIRARYGFDEAAHRAEAEEHNRRFAADKALYARYMELFQAYREYVARAPR